jgi:hypothetical protein
VTSEIVKEKGSTAHEGTTSEYSLMATELERSMLVVASNLFHRAACRSKLDLAG